MALKINWALPHTEVLPGLVIVEVWLFLVKVDVVDVCCLGGPLAAAGSPQQRPHQHLWTHRMLV